LSGLNHLKVSCSRHPAQMCFLQFQTIRSPLSLWKINPLFTKYNQKNPIYTKKGIFFLQKNMLMVRKWIFEKDFKQCNE